MMSIPPTALRAVCATAILLASAAGVPTTSGGFCTCQEYCNNECPDPPNSEVTDCEMLGPADPCLYGGDGCPDGVYHNGCCILWGTPVLIDLGGRGFRLTDMASGVLFPLTDTNFNLQISWTRPGAENAWLALDRNGNGLIDNGVELFGNYTEQPEPPPDAMRNGFRALREFDTVAKGGNADGRIDAQDAVFPRLLLWVDRNHDGVSQPMELETLASRGITAIELDYRLSRRVDQYGNQFRYLARVHSARGHPIGRWAADVFLRASRAHKH